MSYHDKYIKYKMKYKQLQAQNGLGFFTTKKSPNPTLITKDQLIKSINATPDHSI